MLLWHSPEDIPADVTSVVTIGIFDGVHRGHHVILTETVRQARERGALAVALTFDPHPRVVHNPSGALPLVTSLKDRIQRLESLGIDAVYVQHYDLTYANTTPEDFLDGQVLGQLHAAAVVVGEDVRFGRNNAGNAAYLTEWGVLRGVDVVVIPDQAGEDGRRWSSSWVRERLADGDVSGAAEILGRAHRIRGEVVHGHKRGRALGFPTANVRGDATGEIPADGVYAGWLIRDISDQASEYFPAAISVGTNPQFDGIERTVEAHVLGRTDLNLYGEVVAIEFVKYLRPMATFNSVDELLEQMDEDLRQTSDALGVPRATRVDPAAVTAM